MVRGLRYFLAEAVTSLWRGRWNASLSVVTIAAGLFVLGFFLIVNSNVQRLVGRWSEAAELSVFLTDDATPEQLQAIGNLLDKSGLAASRQFVSKGDAAERFREDFPDLAAAAARLERNPFPASIEVRLGAASRGAGRAVDDLATALGLMPGVSDVRYDRRWLDRLNSAIRLVRRVGAILVVMLVVAAALTVANVVRLTAYARRDEIEIMQLVGAPLSFVRGPFVLEGILQGGAGALVAIALLWAFFLGVRARFGAAAADALGLGAITFLPAGLWLLLIGGGMLLGFVGGYVVARSVR
jgi:cell division transport system permease protein